MAKKMFLLRFFYSKDADHYEYIKDNICLSGMLDSAIRFGMHLANAKDLDKYDHKFLEEFSKYYLAARKSIKEKKN